MKPTQRSILSLLICSCSSLKDSGTALSYTIMATIMLSIIMNLLVIIIHLTMGEGGGCLRFEGNTRGINSTERNFISECQVKKQFQDTNILSW